MIILAHRGLNHYIKANAAIESNVKSNIKTDIERKNAFSHNENNAIKRNIESNIKAHKSGNSLQNFCESFSLGYGVETDIRDYCLDLVISHDMADSNAESFETFLQTYQKHGNNLTLALNIKADGLCVPLKKALQQYCIDNYFVFDMSLPDMLSYIKHDMNVFTRQSEYEKIPALYDKAKGVWLDEFCNHWISEEIILKHLDKNKQICIVSPDLHKRDFWREWDEYRYIINKHKLHNKIMLCTDYTQTAREFFHG